MNKNVECAIKKIEGRYYIPELEVGEICEINDLWDGNGEVPEDSFSIKIENDENMSEWINYEFEIVEEKNNPLDTIIKIKDINLI